mmetsp:Transcript_5757/g.12553  ORF Transcript_5757/g.12553 Transcript_5757/m.12553 type:complete len:259 (+) Transcript_5757:956-1732(+)
MIRISERAMRTRELIVAEGLESRCRTALGATTRRAAVSFASHPLLSECKWTATAGRASGKPISCPMSRSTLSTSVVSTHLADGSEYLKGVVSFETRSHSQCGARTRIEFVSGSMPVEIRHIAATHMQADHNGRCTRPPHCGAFRPCGIPHSLARGPTCISLDLVHTHSLPEALTEPQSSLAHFRAIRHRTIAPLPFEHREPTFAYKCERMRWSVKKSAVDLLCLRISTQVDCLRYGEALNETVAYIVDCQDRSDQWCD